MPHIRNKQKLQSLESADIPGLAKYIKSKECRHVIVMLGAGVSTSAGIPDFRSPETGLYANLARLKLPYPEAVFEINFFRRNPVPFYTLAHELYPGKFRPTLTHSFVRLLAEKDRLHRCFTQNIDTLERRSGIPSHKIIEAHGSFATQRCIDCKKKYDDDAMKAKVFAKEIARCDSCGGLVKPDIVFFGESLPPEFTREIPSVGMADLLIVIGTSLTVHPFAALATLPNQLCPRVLINMDLVGDFGRRSDDVVLLGKCDEIVEQLAEELGWGEELQKLWNETALPGHDSEAADAQAEVPDAKTEVEKLAEQIGATMSIKDDVAPEKQAPDSEKEESKESLKTSNPTDDSPAPSPSEAIVQGEKLPESVLKDVSVESAASPAKEALAEEQGKL